MSAAALLLMLLFVTSVERGTGQVQVRGLFPCSSFEGIQRELNGHPRTFFTLPPINLARVLAQELSAEERPVKGGSSGGYKFGEDIPVEIDIDRDGEWGMNMDGTAKVWRAVVRSMGAKSLSILFDTFYLPPGSELYLIGRNVHIHISHTSQCLIFVRLGDSGRIYGKAE